MDIDQSIIDYYNKGKEKDRLLTESSLERIRTLDILSRYLSNTNAILLDIGGGAGFYSFALSEKGFKVHLLDAVSLHIDQANKSNENSEFPLESIKIGDARSLPYEDGFADVVLCFGPLYHITDKNDRIKVLVEIFRVLKPNGIIFSVGISKFASFLDGFERKFIFDEKFRKIVLNDLKTGQHRNPDNIEHYFTTAYFHDPNELLIEHIEAGFNDLELLAIEGPIGLMSTIPEFLESEEGIKIVLEFSRKIEKEQTLMGASSHIMVIAKK